MKLRTNFKKQAGMTLTESLLVLAVGALVAVLAYSGYRMATSDVKAQGQADTTVALVGKVKQLYSGAANYGTASADITGTIVNSKIVPDGFKTSGTTISNAWGGAVVVSAGANNLQFTVSLANIPVDTCAGFLAGVTKAANIDLTMGGTSVYTSSAIDPAKVATQCAANTTGTGANSTAVLTIQ